MQNKCVNNLHLLHMFRKSEFCEHATSADCGTYVQESACTRSENRNFVNTRLLLFAALTSKSLLCTRSQIRKFVNTRLLRHIRPRTAATTAASHEEARLPYSTGCRTVQPLPEITFKKE